jgi:RHS repeat-associated protein
VSQPPAHVYNAENQMTSYTNGATTTTYSYDGDGRRVEKSGGKIYWYGGGSDALDETDLSGNTNNSTFSEYLFFDGSRMVRRDYQGNIFYYSEDLIGTSRELVQSGQTSPCFDADFFPYGGEMDHTITCTQNYKFTGKERDAESGLDNFGARYNASTMGRFMTPDPANIGVNRLNPQSWNAYSYSLNNPLSLTDPTGLYVCEDSTSCSSQNDQNFAKSLADAQTAANNLTGDDKAAAQRAIDAYGAQGVDNGVNVRFDGNVTSGTAVTEVSGVANGSKSADNPTGQNINVTFNPDAVGKDESAGLVAHEGSHVADGSDWVKSGFSANMDRTHNQTEMNANHVQFNIMNAQLGALYPNGYTAGLYNNSVKWNKGDTFKMITPDLQKAIQKANGAYDTKPAFTKGWRLQP